MTDSRLGEKLQNWRRSRIRVGVLLFFSIYCFLMIFNVEVVSVNTFLQPDFRPDLVSPSLSPSHDEADCPAVPAKLEGRLAVIQTPTSWQETEAVLNNSNIQPGGLFIPPCKSHHRVAIIVPFRDRESHLRIFLKHIHPVLMRQDILYRIFVISQEDGLVFNRAMLFNVGSVEASKLSPWDCLGL